MINQHVPAVDLEAYGMDKDSIDTLSYIFCDNIAFNSFADLLLYFTVGMPDSEQIREFWDEVEDLGWA